MLSAELILARVPNDQVTAMLYFLAVSRVSAMTPSWTVVHYLASPVIASELSRAPGATWRAEFQSGGRYGLVPVNTDTRTFLVGCALERCLINAPVTVDLYESCLRYYSCISTFSGVSCSKSVLSIILPQPFACLDSVTALAFHGGRKTACLQIIPPPTAPANAMGSPQPRKRGESTNLHPRVLAHVTIVQGFEDWQNPSSTGGTSGLAISADWLTRALELRSDARYIVVVEKDGVFNRMVEDGFHDRLSLQKYS